MSVFLLSIGISLFLALVGALFVAVKQSIDAGIGTWLVCSLVALGFHAYIFESWTDAKARHECAAAGAADAGFLAGSYWCYRSPTELFKVEVTP